jgi:hypothetical protein
MAGFFLCKRRIYGAFTGLIHPCQIKVAGQHLRVVRRIHIVKSGAAKYNERFRMIFILRTLPFSIYLSHQRNEGRPE